MASYGVLGRDNYLQMANKSLYDMTPDELNEYAPQDFNQAVIKEFTPLVESWRKTPYLHPSISTPFRGKTQEERDLNEAMVARVLQNYIDSAYGGKMKGRDGHRTQVDVAEAMQRIETQTPKDQDLLSQSIDEAATIAQTSGYGAATLLPMVLAMVRKIMPRLNATEFFQVQALDRPTGLVYYLARNRENNGTFDGQVEQRAGWSYRSWAMSPGETQAITKSVSFTITNQSVSVSPYKLLAKTSFEVEMDLRAYFGMDAVSLVSDIAADEFAAEIDERLIKALYYEAVSNGVGQYQYGTSVPSGHTQDSWDKRLLQILNRAAMGIYTQKLVRPNWLIMGTEWESQASLLPFILGTERATSFGSPITLNGNINGFNAATIPFPFPPTEAIMGYKGNSWLDGTAFYLPYMPVTLYSIHPDPDTQVRTLSWMMRDGMFFNRFSGLKEPFAWLSLSPSINGQSYPSVTTQEYVG